MTRNPRLEAYLRARYEYDTCEPSCRLRCRANLHSIATQLLALHQQQTGQSITLEDLEQITMKAYQEYRRAQQRQQQRKLNRIR
jgi:hypothetical protein